MKESERVENVLILNAFSRGNMPDEWTRDQWTVRFNKDEMEIYEKLPIKGTGRYLLTELDAEILREILEDL